MHSLLNDVINCGGEKSDCREKQPIKPSTVLWPDVKR